MEMFGTDSILHFVGPIGSFILATLSGRQTTLVYLAIISVIVKQNRLHYVFNKFML